MSESTILYPVSNTSREEFLAKKKRQKQFITGMRLFILIFILGGWEIAARCHLIGDFIFSSPTRILKVMVQMAADKSLFYHIGITIGETLISFILVLILGTFISMLLWWCHSAADILEPYLVVLNSLPKTALAPILIVWLGNNMKTIIVCGVAMAIFSTIIKGWFGTPCKTWVTFRDVAMLLCISLAVTPAFKMRFWNIGGEGQTLMGCLASASCMILLRDVLPNWALILVMLLTSMLAGAIWGGIPALFKAKWNTNETLFTLMMNYVATQLVAYFCIFWESPKGSGKIGIINQRSQIGWLPKVADQQYLLNIIVVGVLVLLMFLYLYYTKHGYEISVVGESQRTARYVGIKVEWVIIRTMLISGAICGLAGFLLTAGSDHTLTTTLVDGRGFTAVMVSWLAKFNPFVMIFTSFLLVFLDRGAGEVSSKFGLNQSFADIITGVILFFIIGCEFFINYKISFCKRNGKVEKLRV